MLLYQVNKAFVYLFSCILFLFRFNKIHRFSMSLPFQLLLLALFHTHSCKGLSKIKCALLPLQRLKILLAHWIMMTFNNLSAILLLLYTTQLHIIFLLAEILYYKWSFCRKYRGLSNTSHCLYVRRPTIHARNFNIVLSSFGQHSTCWHC